MGVCGRRLHQPLEAGTRARREAEVGGDERVTTVDGDEDERATRPQPAADAGEGGRRVGEVLDREARQDDVERGRREGVRLAAQVGLDEVVEMGQRPGAGRWMSAPTKRPIRAR